MFSRTCLFVTYGQVSLRVYSLLTCLLNLIYLAGFNYFISVLTFFNTVIYFTIAICIHSTEIDNQSSIYSCLQPFVNLEQLKFTFSKVAGRPVILLEMNSFAGIFQELWHQIHTTTFGGYFWLLNQSPISL